MELEIRRRESTGSGPNTYVETETLAKFELMDGAPVRGTYIGLAPCHYIILHFLPETLVEYISSCHVFAVQTDCLINITSICLCGCHYPIFESLNSWDKNLQYMLIVGAKS